MKQLVRDGWIHHMSKMLVASFLTQNGLSQSWQVGRNFFAKYLLDADSFINDANWKLFDSKSAFQSNLVKLYSSINFYKKYDPKGNYVRHFLPALKDVPSEFIYEPWGLPLETQKKIGCLIGKDYPRPIAKVHRMIKMYRPFAKKMRRKTVLTPKINVNSSCLLMQSSSLYSKLIFDSFPIKEGNFPSLIIQVSAEKEIKEPSTRQSREVYSQLRKRSLESFEKTQ